MKFVTVMQFFGCKVMYIFWNDQFYQIFDIAVFVKVLTKIVAAAAVQVWSRMKFHRNVELSLGVVKDAEAMRIVPQENFVNI